MPSYEWKGRDRNGATQTGVLIGDSKDAVVAALRRQQIVVTTVKEKGKEIALPKFGGGVSSKDIAVFTRQFSVMIDAGLPLVQCLDILGQQQDNKAFQKIILQVRQDVEGGSSLAEAMRKHPTAFDDLYVNMVAAGEAGGILDTILQRLATYIEKSVKLKSQVKSAMVYPVSVVTIAVIVVYVILWKVIPVFAALFEGLGGQLPFLTQIVVNMSNFIGNFWWLILMVVGRRHLRASPVLPDGRWPLPDRQDNSQDAGPWHPAPQDRRCSFLPNAGHPSQLGCGDPRITRNHRSDRGQRCHRGSSHASPQGGRGGQNHRRTVDPFRAVPSHGLPNDRGW